MRNAQNALRPSRHDSPKDPLRGHSDYVAFEGPKHCVDSPSLVSSSYCSTNLERPAGFEPAYTSFVAKAIIPLWHGRINLVGELRIELRPRAPKARMQRITLFPDGASASESDASLKFSAERIDRAYATGEIWWTVWESNPPDYPACKAGDHPE